MANPYALISDQYKQNGQAPLSAVIPPPEPVMDTTQTDNLYSGIALAAERESQGVPGEEEPMNWLEQVYQSSSMALDYVQGAAHGVLTDMGSRMEMGAFGIPQMFPNVKPLLEMPQVQSKIQDATAAGKDALMALSPLDEPKSPEERLGFETSFIPEVAVGGGLAKAGVKAMDNVGLGPVVKKMVQGGDDIDAVPEMLRAVSRPEGLPKGVSLDESKRIMDEAEAYADDAHEKILGPMFEEVMTTGLGKYRTRIAKLLQSKRGFLISKQDQTSLLAWEGMTAKQFINLHYKVKMLTKKPDSKFAVESPKQANARGAYTEVLNTMDDLMNDVIPPNAVLKRYGEGVQMYKVVKQWEEAKKVFSVGISYSTWRRYCASWIKCAPKRCASCSAPRSTGLSVPLRWRGRRRPPSSARPRRP
jgi:hypothetical protein